MRKGASPLDFDVDLAKRQTDENPVFYVQMAHARLSGIFRTAERDARERDRRRSTSPRSRRRRTPSCSRSWSTFPEVVEKRRARARAAPDHRLSSTSCATRGPRLVSPHAGARRAEGPATEQARLLLARAARIVLANGLALLGISAPDRM